MKEVLSLNLRLKQAIEWLKANKQMKQMDIAKQMGMAEASFSRALKRCEERVDTNFVIKFQQKTEEIFSIEWLLEGTGPKFTKDLDEPVSTPSAAPIDSSSAFNAAISAYVQLVESRNKEIEEKNARIKDLERTIQDKETIIKDRDAKIVELERRLAAVSTSDLERYPFAIGAAEHDFLQK